MAPNENDKGKNRNQMCPCNSGLKVKNCHGDASLKRDASMIANAMLTLYILERRIDKGLEKPDEATKLIDKLVSDVDGIMPCCVTLETNYEVRDDEPPVPDKLEEKEAEGCTIGDLQEQMVKCDGCGRRLPAGMECMKCKKEKTL